MSGLILSEGLDVSKLSLLGGLVMLCLNSNKIVDVSGRGRVRAVVALFGKHQITG